MSEVDKEAQAVTGLIKGVKILVPFAVSIASVVGVYYAMDNRLNIVEKELAKAVGRVEVQDKLLTQHSITLSEVKTDIKHIKDDTKETLNLVRTLYRQR